MWSTPGVLGARGAWLIRMTYVTSYSILITPGEKQLCLTLVVSAWDKRQGLLKRSLRTVWTPWQGWQRPARQLVEEGVALASDTIARQDPLF